MICCGWLFMLVGGLLCCRYFMGELTTGVEPPSGSDSQIAKEVNATSVHLQHLAHERSGARFIHPGLGRVRPQLDYDREMLEQSNTSNPLLLRGVLQVAPSRFNTSVRSLAKEIAYQFDSPDNGLRACDGLPAADHTWVGVVRKAPGCDKNQVGDGWSRGWLADNRNYDELNISARAIAAGFIKESASGNRLHIGWGCWFYAMRNASGWSGAYVNVGRSLRVTTRCTANRILYGIKGSSNALCTSNPGDKLWCTFARARGYDSIQIVRGSLYYGSSRGRRRPWSELVVCSGECMSRNFADDACVPMARAMSPSSGMEPCACPAGSKELVCGVARSTNSCAIMLRSEPWGAPNSSAYLRIDYGRGQKQPTLCAADERLAGRTH